MPSIWYKTCKIPPSILPKIGPSQEGKFHGWARQANRGLSGAIRECNHHVAGRVQTAFPSAIAYWSRCVHVWAIRLRHEMLSRGFLHSLTAFTLSMRTQITPQLCTSLFTHHSTVDWPRRHCNYEPHIPAFGFLITYLKSMHTAHIQFNISLSSDFNC